MEATVDAVTSAGQDEPMFNLILGDSTVFVAGDFLARGKAASCDFDRTAQVFDRSTRPRGQREVLIWEQSALPLT